MSTESPTPHTPDLHAAGHASSHDAPHLHVLPVKAYVGIWGVLMICTVLTVAVASVPLGPANVPIALAIATFKATMVALFFMHLYWDDKFNGVVFCSALLFLGIFFGLTLLDLTTRGAVDQIYEANDFGPEMTRLSANFNPLTANAPTSGTQGNGIGAAGFPGALPPPETITSTNTKTTTGTQTPTPRADGKPTPSPTPLLQTPTPKPTPAGK